MAWISKQKFFNRYLPIFFSMVLIVAAVFTYQFFIHPPQAAQALTMQQIISGQTQGRVLGASTPEKQIA